MDLSRRRMLQGTGAMFMVVATPLRWVGTAGAAPGKTATKASWLSRSSYVPLVGTAFTVGAATLTLSAIRDLPAQGVKERPNLADGRFSLLFTSGSVVGQATQTISHPGLGESALFVVPVGPKAAVRNYEVIVNRLT